MRATAAAALGAWVAGCGGSGQTKAGSAAAGTTLHVHGRQTAFAPIFQGRGGFRPGDQFVYTDDLDGGGHEKVFCVISPGRPGAYLCTLAFVLPRGQIIAEGVTPPPPSGPYVLPVVGGSGAYEGARGSVRTSGEGRRGVDVTIRLR